MDATFELGRLVRMLKVTLGMVLLSVGAAAAADVFLKFWEVRGLITELTSREVIFAGGTTRMTLDSRTIAAMVVGLPAILLAGGVSFLVSALRTRDRQPAA